MVAIVNTLNRSLYAAELDEMFRFRHQVAVVEMGWDLPDARDGWEQDQFDTDDATYLLDWDSKGRMSACVRLIPTDKPHLISEVFADYCDLAPCPRDADVLECSRFLVRREGATKESFVNSRSRIMVAMHEYAFANGYSSITALTYQKLYELAAFLFRTRPLGLARYCEEDDDHYIALQKEVSEEGIAKMCEHLNVPRNVGRFEVPLGTVSTLLTGVRPDQSAVAA